MKKENVIVEKSKVFAIDIVKLYQYLCNSKHEYILSKQLLRSGTSIGANISEAVHAQSRADFHAKASIAEKEAGETSYWLELLYETEYLDQDYYEQLMPKCEELIKILVAITKNTKSDK